MDLIVKKKLLITVGAGASLSFGLPSVGAVGDILEARALLDFPLADNCDDPDQPQRSLYTFIRDQLDVYYAQSQQEHMTKWANFEDVLYQINLLAAFLDDDLFQNGGAALLQSVQLPRVRQYGRKITRVTSEVLRRLASSMQDAIVDHFTSVCAALPEAQAENIADLKRLLDSLSEEFDIGVVTLNYDNVFSLARPDLYTGFCKSTGEFEPLEVLDRTDWNFIYHAHGSIHFAMDSASSHDMHRIRWRNELDAHHTNHATGRNSQSTTKGIVYPTSTIIAGYGKTQQMLRQPFRTFFAQMNRLVLESDALLFIGYGFGDLHLNAAFSEAGTRPRPTAIITMADKKDHPFSMRRDAWRYNLGGTVPKRPEMSDDCKAVTPHRPVAYGRAGKFEDFYEDDHPLSIWYSGLMSKKLYIGELISRLKLDPSHPGA